MTSDLVVIEVRSTGVADECRTGVGSRDIGGPLLFTEETIGPIGYIAIIPIRASGQQTLPLS